MVPPVVLGGGMKVDMICADAATQSCDISSSSWSLGMDEEVRDQVHMFVGR